VQKKAEGFFHCPEYGSAGKQALLAREEKREAFGGGTGTDRNTLHVAAYQITAARQKKKEAHNGIF